MQSELANSQQKRSAKRKDYFSAAIDMAIISASIMLLYFILTSNTENMWIGHAAAGAVSLLFTAFGIFFGAMMVGRVKRFEGVNAFKLHRKISVYVTILILATFIYGLWLIGGHGESMFWEQSESFTLALHGWVGLAVVAIALSQTLPSFLLKKTKTKRTVHTILGYVLMALLLLQLFLGMQLT